MYHHNPDDKSNVLPWLLIAAGAGGVYYWYSKSEQEKKAKEQAAAGAALTAGTPASVSVVAGDNPVATVTPNATLTISSGVAGSKLVSVVSSSNPGAVGPNPDTAVNADGTATLRSNNYEVTGTLLTGTLADASGNKTPFKLPVSVLLPAKK